MNRPETRHAAPRSHPSELTSTAAAETGVPMFVAPTQTSLNAAHLFFFLARPRNFDGERSVGDMAGSGHVSVKIRHSQLTLQSCPLTERTWQCVRGGLLPALCRARTSNGYLLSPITIRDSLFPSPRVSSSEDAVD